jgi:hypothetical protein
MALVSTGGIDPLYSGAQINQRLALQVRQGGGDPGRLGPWREQGQRDGGEIEQVGALAPGGGGIGEALRQLKVLAVAGGDQQEIRGWWGCHRRSGGRLG